MTIFTTYSAADSAIGWALVIIGALGAVAFAASFLDGPRDRLAAWLYRRRVRSFGPGTGRHTGTSGHLPETPATLVASLPAISDRTGGTIPGVIVHDGPPWGAVPIQDGRREGRRAYDGDQLIGLVYDADHNRRRDWGDDDPDAPDVDPLRPYIREHFSRQHAPRHAPTQPREHV